MAPAAGSHPPHALHASHALHADLTALLAETGIVDVDVDEAVADEHHLRLSVYLRVVAVTAASRSRDRDPAIVATLLRDPDASASKAAVVALVDALATKATGPAEFRQWSAALLPELDQLPPESYREFIRRRIHDWRLYLSVEHGHPPTATELAAATHWMQRKLAEESTSTPVLTLLAESGSTRKIRNIAKNRPRADG